MPAGVNLCHKPSADTSVLGISKAGAYTLAHSRDFPAFRVGRRIVISQEKFLDWLEKQTAESSLT